MTRVELSRATWLVRWLLAWFGALAPTAGDGAEVLMGNCRVHVCRATVPTGVVWLVSVIYPDGMTVNGHGGTVGGAMLGCYRWMERRGYPRPTLPDLP